MRVHRVGLFVLLVLTTLISPSTQCIDGCKCQEKKISQPSLTISDCDSPLILTKQVLSDVSKKLEVINFKNLDINRVEKGAFDEFDVLRDVIIDDCQIGSVDSSAFDLPEIKSVNFRRTSFVEVPSLNSEYLEELMFEGCKLSQVPNLNGLKALVFLNVANNTIQTIDEMTFAQAEAIEEVNFSHNSIAKLPPNLFVHNPSFSTLNLDYNPLETFELNLRSDLEWLSLRFCKLSSFDTRFTENLTALNLLDLAGNQIEALPIDAFELMPSLTNIDLGNNKLIELDDDIFSKNPNLDRIVLDNNPIETLPYFALKDGSKFFQARYLSCQNCSLKSLGSFHNKSVSSLENMKQLVTLVFSNNKIETIDGALDQLTELTDLRLSNNNIKFIATDALKQNEKLQSLDISGNPLSPLDPALFSKMVNFVKLNVTDTGLSRIWANYGAILQHLESLYVANNKITSISVDDLKVIPALRVIDLLNNPLECSEDLSDMIEFFAYKMIVPNEVKTHEETMRESRGVNNFNLLAPKISWLRLLAPNCKLDLSEDEENLDDVDKNVLSPEYKIDDEDEDPEAYYDDADYKAGEMLNKDDDLNLTKASYILSITSVFVLTALVVLTVAVTVTLLILKRNKKFNMHNGNLPRLKIPLWHTQPGQKKHSGSVYRPLSEDLSGGRTPIINRYEFKQTPQVHNSLP